MLPLWLVYILVVLLLTIDILLVIGVVLVGLFLVAYIAFNIATTIIGVKIDRYIKERLDRMREEAGKKSQNMSKATGYVKTIYSLLFILYKIYDIGTGLIISLVALVLLVIGFAGLAVVNIVLLWLLNAYVF
jgi:hypothetical protein